MTFDLIEKDRLLEPLSPKNKGQTASRDET